MEDCHSACPFPSGSGATAEPRNQHTIVLNNFDRVCRRQKTSGDPSTSLCFGRDDKSIPVPSGPYKGRRNFQNG